MMPAARCKYVAVDVWGARFHLETDLLDERDVREFQGAGERPASTTRT